MEKSWLVLPIQPANKRALISSKKFLIFYIILIFKVFCVYLFVCFSSHVLSNMKHMFPCEGVFSYGSNFLSWPFGSM